MLLPGSSHCRYYGRRFKLLWGFFALLFLILVGSLIARQIVEHDKYKQQEQRQSFRRIIQPGPRGEIYDRNGKLLVGNRPRFCVALFPNEIRPEIRKRYYQHVRAAREQSDAPKDSQTLYYEACVEVVQSYLDQVNAITQREDRLDLKMMKGHFSQRLLLPFTLVSDLPAEAYAKILETVPIHSPLQPYTDSVRYYPYGKAACHALGYVGIGDTLPQEDLPGEPYITFATKSQVGRSGLERSFDAHLAGKSGYEIWQVDLVGFQHECKDKQAAVQGAHLYTSLDIDLQNVSQEALKGRKGAVVAIEVQSGEVLCLASSPDYDLNLLSPRIDQATYKQIEDKGGWLNRATQGLYPPGSIYKLITATAAFKAGVITPESAWECGAFFKVGNRNFPEHERQALGWTDIRRALSHSSNVFCYDIGLQMGPNALAQESRLYGLDEPTGIELPFEATRMVVPDPAWKKRVIKEPWRGGDTANLSIGQGYLLTTPLQMACFGAAFARGTYRCKPTLLHQDYETPPFPIPPLDQRAQNLGLKAEEYSSMIEGLEQTTLKGTGRLGKIDGLRIASKTGTAQVRYNGLNSTLGWSLQFAPIEDPTIALLVMVEGTNPHDAYHGGTTCSPIAKKILKRYFGL